MATAGHTLTGLSLAGCGLVASCGGVMLHVWPGFIVLLAHSVDLIGWGAVVCLGPRGADRHFLTHSPAATGAFVVLIWGNLAVAAEASLFDAMALDDSWPWPEIYLARLYSNTKDSANGTFRPKEAERLYRGVLAGPADVCVRGYVARGLAELEKVTSLE